MTQNSPAIINKYRLKQLLNWDYIGVPIILIVLSWIAYSIEPRFLNYSNIINVLGQTSILAIAAFGQAFVIINGTIDISVGSMVALTAIISTIMARDYGLVPGLFAGVVSGALLGYINGFVITRFKVQPVIATIAMLNIARGLAFALSDGQPILGMPDGYSFLGYGKILDIPVRILLALVLLLLGQFFLSKMKTGRKIYAIGGDIEASRISGINVSRIRTLVYVLSGIMAGFTALVISGRANSGQSTIGVYMELNTIAAVVIGGTALSGGRGNLIRTFAGALIITILSNGMNLAGVSPYLQEMTIGFVIILAVLIDKIRLGEEAFLGKIFSGRTFDNVFNKRKEVIHTSDCDE
ncbi:ABC transporter permease [Chloroflexota bacterium]